MTTSYMKAPSGFGGEIQGAGLPTGSNYSVDGFGVVQVDSKDVSALVALGFVQIPALNGLSSTQMTLLHWRNADGTVLDATGGAGKFKIAETYGTSTGLQGESANNNTKTDDMINEIVIPSGYVAGEPLTLTINAKLTGAGTPGTKTLQVKASKCANDGTQGANLGPAAAAAITAAGADIDFAIAPATLGPGDKLAVEIEGILQETASSALAIVVNSIRLH